MWEKTDVTFKIKTENAAAHSAGPGASVKTVKQTMFQASDRIEKERK